MGPSSKKRSNPLWIKAPIHFSICFLTGFLTGFLPSKNLPEPSMTTAAQPPLLQKRYQQKDSAPRNLLILVTAAGGGDGSLIGRMANTLSLVEPPVLWVVVERGEARGEAAGVLRKSRVMHRHLVMREDLNSTGRDGERNAALAHIERHRIIGIVHFVELGGAYDLQFFRNLREIEVYGAWSVAFLSPNRKRVAIEGPICKASQVIGWHQSNLRKKTRQSRLHISSFAFNSSILWDPERWGRASPAKDTNQNLIRFVKEVVMEDEAKLRGIPHDEDCSKLMLWHLPHPTHPHFSQ